MDPLINVQLHVPEVTPLSGFDQHTTLLTTAHLFDGYRLLALCDPSLKRSPDLSNHFHDVKPHVAGGWTLELAIELPDLLPAVDGLSECVVEVGTAGSTRARLCLSNRMSRFIFSTSAGPRYVLLPRTKAWHGGAMIGTESNPDVHSVEQQLRTVASMRFAVRGSTTGEALESSITKNLHTLFKSINRVLIAMRECREAHAPVARAINWNAVAHAYVHISGVEKAGWSRIALNGSRVGLNPEVLDPSRTEKLRQISNGSVSVGDVERIMSEARSSLDDGEYEFAFLQMVIAAEMATSRAVRAECLRRGVLEGKFDDHSKDMTYSWALNIGLPMCFSSGARPADSLISAMNAARSQRNVLVHQGKFSGSREGLMKLAGETQSYVTAIQAAVISAGAGSSPASKMPSNSESQTKTMVLPKVKLFERIRRAWLVLTTDDWPTATGRVREQIEVND